MNGFVAAGQFAATKLQRLRAHTASPVVQRLATVAFWSVAAEAVSRGLLMLAFVVVARHLGTSQYGEFGMVRSTINVFATLGGLGLGLTANRFVAEYRQKDPTYSGQIVGGSYLLALASGLIVGAGMVAGARTLAFSWLHAPQLLRELQIAGLLLFFSAVNGAQVGILQGLEAYRLLALGSLAQGLIGLSALIGGAWAGGVTGAVLGLLGYTVAGVVLLHVLITREVRRHGISPRWTRLGATLPLFWKFSLPVTLAGVVIAPLKWTAETLLVRRVGFAELGIFHAALTVTSVFLTLVGTLNAPLITMVANAGGEADGRKLRYVSFYGSWFAFLALAAPILIAPGLVALPFGPAFNTTQFRSVILLLLAYSGLLVYYQGIIRLLTLSGSMWFAFGANLVEGATLVVGFQLLGHQGATGLAWAYILSYVVRVGITLPILVSRRVVSTALLYDKYFVLSALAFGALLALRL